MTIHIPDDLASGLEKIAESHQMSVEQLVVERLRDLVERPTAPAAVLQTIRRLPRPSPSGVDDLDAAIAQGRLPVRDYSIFDK